MNTKTCECGNMIRLFTPDSVVICGNCRQKHHARPCIVCLCGSTRFSEAFRRANLEETLAGKIVLTVGCDFKSDDALGLAPEDKARLDELHLRKIDMADEVLVLNEGGYIGSSTQRELAYASFQGKMVRFLEAACGEAYMQEHSHAIGSLTAGFLLTERRGKL